MGVLDTQATLPPARSYCCKIVFGSIPKAIIIVLAIIIAAYHSELYFAQGTGAAEDQPVLVCSFTDTDDDYYGYRVCNNSIAAAIVAIFVCNVLLIIDLLIPCLNAGLARLSHLFGMIWSIVMAVYYLITSGLTANLYVRYCDRDSGPDCNDDESRFNLFPVLGFFIMIAWVSNYYCMLVNYACYVYN